MPEIVYPQEQGEPVVVNLGNPYVAAALGWLIPGAGHFYQRRFAKGLLFTLCVLVTYFVGLGFGHGRVVYASYRPNDFRWQYPLFQVHCGVVALPALVQAYKTKDGDDPYFVLCERYPGTKVCEKEGCDPSLAFLKIEEVEKTAVQPKTILKDGFMAPPPGVPDPIHQDVLGRWHVDYKHFYELGTLYTMVAGVLNLLAVYDAFCGPAIVTANQRERLEAKKKKRDQI